MNIFSALRVYAGKWQVKDTRDFTADEINAVDHATVVDSQFGKSVCFFMKTGGQTFIPLSNNSGLATGADVDMKSAKLMTLSRDGDADIMRVDA